MSEHSTEVVINQLYFPGWRVILDGSDIPDRILRSRLQDDGKIRFQIFEDNVRIPVEDIVAEEVRITVTKVN